MYRAQFKATLMILTAIKTLTIYYKYLLAQVTVWPHGINFTTAVLLQERMEHVWSVALTADARDCFRGGDAPDVGCNITETNKNCM